jgi:hypothetical protein
VGHYVLDWDAALEKWNSDTNSTNKVLCLSTMEKIYFGANLLMTGMLTDPIPFYIQVREFYFPFYWIHFL